MDLMTVVRGRWKTYEFTIEGRKEALYEIGRALIETLYTRTEGLTNDIDGVLDRFCNGIRGQAKKQEIINKSDIHDLQLDFKRKGSE